MLKNLLKKNKNRKESGQNDFRRDFRRKKKIKILIN